MGSKSHDLAGDLTMTVRISAGETERKLVSIVAGGVQTADTGGGSASRTEDILDVKN